MHFPGVFDEIGGLLGDHDHGRVDVAGRKIRHDGGIDHAQPFNAANPQVRIDDSIGIPPKCKSVSAA